jgi:hypothetical protein
VRQESLATVAPTSLSGEYPAACDSTAECAENQGGRGVDVNRIDEAVIGYRPGYLLNLNISRMKDGDSRMVRGL